jgi:hypothetical protein
MAYSGQYELGPGAVAVFTVENNKMYVEAPGLPRTSTIPVSSNTFNIGIAQAMVTFVRDASGKIDHIKVLMEGQELNAKRLPDFDPSKVDLNQYTGDYYSPELCTTYTIVVKSDKLVARHFRTGDVHLSPIKPDIYTGDQWYFGNVEFVRDNNNLVTGCKATSGRVRNVKFNRMME